MTSNQQLMETACANRAIRENTILARAVHVAAVVAHLPGIDGPARRRDLGEHVGHRGSRRRVGSLKVLVHLVGGPVGGCLLRGRGLANALCQSCLGHCKPITVAVALDLRALAVEGGADGKGLGAVYLGIDLVGVEWYGAHQLGCVFLGRPPSLLNLPPNIIEPSTPGSLTSSSTKVTSRVNLGPLNRSFIKKCPQFKELQVSATIIRNDSLDFRVALQLKLDV
ncbi:hypothetical protein HG531_005612 [Fusarium graminearum]|nr:hypothetical protein HG531_005612 [Fusarium graminearum]